MALQCHSPQLPKGMQKKKNPKQSTGLWHYEENHLDFKQPGTPHGTSQGDGEQTCHAHTELTRQKQTHGAGRSLPLSQQLQWPEVYIKRPHWKQSPPTPRDTHLLIAFALEIGQ